MVPGLLPGDRVLPDPTMRLPVTVPLPFRVWPLASVIPPPDNAVVLSAAPLAILIVAELAILLVVVVESAILL